MHVHAREPRRACEVLARAPRPPKTYILFLKPAGSKRVGSRPICGARATALPNVTVLRDDDGVEARRFGVETSGQTLLYDAQRQR